MANYEMTSVDTDVIPFEEDYDDILFEDDFDISVDDDPDVHKELVNFIDKKASVSTIDTGTIENACRFIFAEDLISCIALEFHGLVYNTRVTKESDLYLNPFSETIKHAACIIRKEINNANSTSFEIIEDFSKSDKFCYKIFIDAVLSHYSRSGLKTGQFFCFCIYICELAAKCYRTDFEEVFEFAVYAILDGFCVYKGRIYELIDFAKAVANKSDRRFLKDNMMAVFGINSEKLKVANKIFIHEVISNLLKLSINENIEKNKEDELEKCREALEQLNIVDKCDKCEVLENFDLSVNEIVQQMAKSVDSHINNCNFCDENCCISLIEKVHDEEYKKTSCQTEKKILENILQELLTAVNFEASLFSAIYDLSKNQLHLVSQDDIQSTSKMEKIESSPCSTFQNYQVRDSSLLKDQVPHDCIKKNVETIVNASVTPNSVMLELEKGVQLSNPSDTLEHVDVTFPNDELKVLELEKNIFIVQRSEDNKIKSSTAEFTANFVEAEFGRKSDEGSIVDYNTLKKVEHDFIKKEVKIFSEVAVTYNSEFKQEENQEALEDEKFNFQNIELKKLDTVQLPLICENPSENNYNKVEENLKQMECKSTEDLDYLSENNIVLPVGTEDEQIVDFFAIYKREGEINEENLKVLKGDTILFAEDFVRYIMEEFYGITYSESKFDGIHCLSCDAFNETVKQVLNFIHDKSEILNRIVFDIIANVKEHNTHCYRTYVATVLGHYDEDGLNSDAFLYFCLHFSELAAKLYTLDHPEVIDFAICSILDAFCLLKDDWCEFKTAAEKVLDIFKTKADDQCTGSKIHCYIDNYEKECVKAIRDSLNTVLNEKIENIFSSNCKTEEKVNHDISAKTVENSVMDVDNSQTYEIEEIIDGKK